MVATAGTRGELNRVIDYYTSAFQSLSSHTEEITGWGCGKKEAENQNLRGKESSLFHCPNKSTF